MAERNSGEKKAAVKVSDLEVLTEALKRRGFVSDYDLQRVKEELEAK